MSADPVDVAAAWFDLHDIDVMSTPLAELAAVLGLSLVDGRDIVNELRRRAGVELAQLQAAGASEAGPWTA